ncbi:BTAD domain-containing putative transcriptional regulator [Streptomyces sp. NPDC051987]|uniref:AfsR/SARP family transcriptional regulator n=1 Tax=Streptomyces sp. NPDC051987 TaxID=3155808 RepID=UPI0034332C36
MRLLLTALCESGRRSDAIARYHSFRELLTHEYGVSPSGQLQAFYEQILQEVVSLVVV